ncbi:hypothetical protein O3P69_014641 [Scylla paramamosain]|uniref:Uncharacterized protein n=1 Tax=Scylla paramamosain TaxID=85552 RepID=A0AAW0TY77_SCYPA
MLSGRVAGGPQRDPSAEAEVRLAGLGGGVGRDVAWAAGHGARLTSPRHSPYTTNHNARHANKVYITLSGSPPLVFPNCTTLASPRHQIPDPPSPAPVTLEPNYPQSDPSHPQLSQSYQPMSHSPPATLTHPQLLSTIHSQSPAILSSGTFTPVSPQPNPQSLMHSSHPESLATLRHSSPPLHLAARGDQGFTGTNSIQ